MFDELEEKKSKTLKELFNAVLYYCKDIKKFWYVIFISSLLCGGLLLYYSYSSKHHFEADLTFVVKSKEAGSRGIESIIGQFGWGGPSGGANLAKVKSVAFSKSVLKKALYDSAVVNGNRDIIINHIYNLYDLKKEWESSEALRGIDKFDYNEEFNDSNIVQNLAFNYILSQVRASKDNSGMLAISMDLETDLISFKVRTINEELSYSLSNSLFNNLNQFYLQDEVSNTKTTLGKLKKETDSVSQLLKSKEFQLANAQDRNYGIILRKNQVNQESIKREIMVLSEIYAEMRKNLEIRTFSLKSNDSIFDVLEHPTLPLERKRKSLVIYTLIGLMFGFVVASVFIVARRYVLDELA